MAAVVAVHSYAGGAGKSHLTANVATLLALDGLRVAVVDLDIPAPGLHLLFAIADADMGYCLKDYLMGECEIEDTVREVGAGLGLAAGGALFVVPSSMDGERILDLQQRGYDIALLGAAIRRLVDRFALDVVVLDTHAGTNDESMAAFAVADTVAVVLRPDLQHTRGSQLTVSLARQMGVPRIVMVLNLVAAGVDLAALRARTEEQYRCEVVAVLPDCQEMTALGSGGVFVLLHPSHRLTRCYRDVASRLRG